MEWKCIKQEFANHEDVQGILILNGFACMRHFQGMKNTLSNASIQKTLNRAL